MSCRGILCLLGVRKMALELQNEAAELHEDSRICQQHPRASAATS